MKLKIIFDSEMITTIENMLIVNGVNNFSNPIDCTDNKSVIRADKVDMSSIDGIKGDITSVPANMERTPVKLTYEP